MFSMPNSDNDNVLRQRADLLFQDADISARFGRCNDAEVLFNRALETLARAGGSLERKHGLMFLKMADLLQSHGRDGRGFRKLGVSLIDLLPLAEAV